MTKKALALVACMAIMTSGCIASRRSATKSSGLSNNWNAGVSAAASSRRTYALLGASAGFVAFSAVGAVAGYYAGKSLATHGSSKGAGSRTGWLEVPQTSLPADKAWKIIKQTVHKELSFDILTEESDYFITNWLNLRQPRLASSRVDTLRGIVGEQKVRLVCLKDGRSPFSAFLRIEAYGGALPVSMRGSPYERRVLLVLHDALAKK